MAIPRSPAILLRQNAGASLGRQYRSPGETPLTFAVAREVPR
jgi:hypothetical protein